MANAYKVIGQVADASANNVTLVADQEPFLIQVSFSVSV